MGGAQSSFVRVIFIWVTMILKFPTSYCHLVRGITQVYLLYFYFILFYIIFLLAYDREEYLAAGRVLAYMVAMGCTIPQMFSPFLYAIVAYGARHVQPQIHDVLDFHHQLQLFRVCVHIVQSIFISKMLSINTNSRCQASKKIVYTSPGHVPWSSAMVTIIMVTSNGDHYTMHC